MSSLLPEKWSEGLELANDKIGNFLNRLVPWNKQEQLPERITADTLPAFMQLGGPLLDKGIFRGHNAGYSGCICPLLTRFKMQTGLHPHLQRRRKKPLHRSTPVQRLSIG